MIDVYCSVYKGSWVTNWNKDWNVQVNHQRVKGYMRDDVHIVHKDHK